ncbi:hypothetical protein JXA47_14190 [Candidatus Sumerlaeota bacterium]|nr:hypothetical protein [Candidatus Sumerlaeota bacterium]
MRFLGLCLALISLASPALAQEGCALALSMNLEEMVSRADTVFVGECVSAEASQTLVGGASLPVTVFTFSVEEMIRGAGRGTLTFRQFGHPPSSAAGTRGMDNMATFAPGERYLLLLAAPVRPGGLTTTIGLDQGAFHLEEIEGQFVALNGRNNLGLLSGLSPSGRMRAQSVIQGAGDQGDQLLALVRALAMGTTP